VWFEGWEQQNRLKHVPQHLSVSKVLYATEEVWGFGPGGNEAGVIVYELPDSATKEIKKAGISYLAKLPPKSLSSNDGRDLYQTWQHTPMHAAPDWADKSTTWATSSAMSTPQLANYLNQYGFGVEIDADIEREINEALSKPGSYFTYGRIGILIVIPDIRKVVYAYNG
jgi:hypothetical protein